MCERDHMCERSQVQECACEIEYGLSARAQWCSACARDFDQWCEQQSEQAEFEDWIAEMERHGGWDWDWACYRGVRDLVEGETEAN